MNIIHSFKACLVVGLFCATAAFADSPVVDVVKLTPLGGTSWRVDVTVSHADTGWEHYANGWRVSDAAGEELGFRVLHHPHVKEQPFTRSLTLDIPESVTIIRVQAIDLLHGAGELSAEVVVPR